MFLSGSFDNTNIILDLLAPQHQFSVLDTCIPLALGQVVSKHSNASWEVEVSRDGSLLHNTQNIHLTQRLAPEHNYTEHAIHSM